MTPEMKPAFCFFFFFAYISSWLKNHHAAKNVFLVTSAGVGKVLSAEGGWGRAQWGALAFPRTGGFPLSHSSRETSGGSSCPMSRKKQMECFGAVFSQFEVRTSS